MTRESRQLPPDEVALLQKLREDGQPSLKLLRGRVAALRDAGWTLAAVGGPIGANRSTTRMWQSGAKLDDVEAAMNLRPVPVAPIRSAQMRVIRAYPDVPPAERDELAQLAASARMVRGHTPQDAKPRQDAAEFERRLVALDRKGVPMKRIADHLGVTHHAISARLARAKMKARAS